MYAERSSVSLLAVDPGLGRDLEPEQRERAARELIVEAHSLPIGTWEAGREPPASDRHLGLLVLRGLLAREVVVAQTTCAELVGSGDILRPWDHFEEAAPMPYEVEWRVLEPTRLAVFDSAATEAACRYPAVATAIVARSVTRVRGLAFSLAITCITGVRVRLLVLFWHLADRWGKVRPEGVFLPLRLTHELLGKLVGAQRPSVSTALGELDREGAVQRRGDGWVLSDGPPAALEAMRERRASTLGA